MATTSTTTTTISPSTITLDDSIVNTSYSLDNIITVDVNKPTASITTGTPYTITGSTGASSICEADPFKTSITIGKQVLNEEKIEKLTALLDILEGAEGSELQAMLETQLLLNKVRNG